MKTLNYLLKLKGQYYSKKFSGSLARIHKEFYHRGKWMRWNGFAMGDKWLEPVVELLRRHRKLFLATHTINVRIRARRAYK
jgi:hypothetical protein